MEENININIDDIIDNHYDNTPIIDTNEDSDDVFNNEVPEHLKYLDNKNVEVLSRLFKSRF